MKELKQYKKGEQVSIRVSVNGITRLVNGDVFKVEKTKQEGVQRLTIYGEIPELNNKAVSVIVFTDKWEEGEATI